MTKIKDICMATTVWGNTAPIPSDKKLNNTNIGNPGNPIPLRSAGIAATAAGYKATHPIPLRSARIAATAAGQPGQHRGSRLPKITFNLTSLLPITAGARRNASLQSPLAGSLRDRQPPRLPIKT